MPEMPKILNVPKMPKMPKMPNLPKMPKITKLQKKSKTPKMPKIQKNIYEHAPIYAHMKKLTYSDHSSALHENEIRQLCAVFLQTARFN